MVADWELPQQREKVDKIKMKLVAAFVLLADFSTRINPEIRSFSQKITFLFQNKDRKCFCPNFMFLSPSLSLRSDLIVCFGSYFIVCRQRNKRKVGQAIKVGFSFISWN